jgi:hypothetical protein
LQAHSISEPWYSKEVVFAREKFELDLRKKTNNDGGLK